MESQATPQNEQKDTESARSREQELKESIEKIKQFFQEKNMHLSIVEKGTVQKILEGKLSIKNHSKKNKLKISKIYPKTMEVQCKLLRKSLFYLKRRMEKIQKNLEKITTSGSTEQANP